MMKPGCRVVIIVIGLMCFGAEFSGAVEHQNDQPGMEQKTRNASALLTAAARSGSTAQDEPGSIKLQERAVQRTGPSMPGMTPMAPRKEFAGAILENNRLRAKPGYVLELLPGNKVVAKRAGGGSGGTWDIKCGACSKKGKCELVRTPDSIYCLGECTGNCPIDIRPAGGGKLLIR